MVYGLLAAGSQLMMEKSTITGIVLFALTIGPYLIAQSGERSRFTSICEKYKEDNLAKISEYRKTISKMAIDSGACALVLLLILFATGFPTADTIGLLGAYGFLLCYLIESKHLYEKAIELIMPKNKVL
jgi:hypothetical protein